MISTTIPVTISRKCLPAGAENMARRIEPIWCHRPECAASASDAASAR